ncbi:Cysteine--tRNA ligase [Candidatus Portiera aleyrodidarum]|uniref:Cysteine--tRNA ligase n=1 Tax=Candidatus Portiera aleyrodidarum TV TaxID=1297582 RepID=A0A8D3XB46_9GAMM|nr:cysteine--tRNA ligase [Candidatus Portiera aleyrodidarum]AGI27189.1 cysteinyl-tRNA synthetase [Candidatus Portiera aleyrodidarum TV]CEI59173.1 Cysteine--tRNA ligase [Candidatus Portiera aleyrodidarum]
MFIYNTLKNYKDLLIPIKYNKLKIYVCGITVYDYCHIGHGRNMFIFYLINKYLKIRGYKITYVRNITDIDNKIINKSIKNKESINRLTNRIITSIYKDEKQLGLFSPDYEPKVSKYKNIIIYYINKLIKKDYAYIIQGNVYFKINKHNIYGILSNQTLKNLYFFFRIKKDKYKTNNLDFSLWKKTHYKYGWESPYSMGFPGWHIECSVLSKIYLGNKFDIHGGGLDLIFPHHENEKSQSELMFCTTHVNIWIHSGHINKNDKKMSKSLNNIIVLRKLLKQYHPEVIKYFFLLTHYRKSINYTKDSLDMACNSLKRFYNIINMITPIKGKKNNLFYNKFILALENDFNTVKAISILFDILYKINKSCNLGKIKTAQYLCFELIRLGNIIGIFNSLPKVFLKKQLLLNINKLENFILKRNIAKNEKNFLKSDKFRNYLKNFDVVFQDTFKRNIWFIQYYS